MMPAPMADDETTLLDRARGRDPQAFAALVQQHEGALVRFARRVCGGADDAEDVLQEGLLSAWNALGDFRGDASVRTWLFTILRRACWKKRRRRADEPADFAPVEAMASAGDAGRAAKIRELGGILDEVIAELSPDAREVILLRDVEGFSGAEVAQIVGVSLPAMKSRLHRARLELRERLEARLGHSVLEELA